MPRPYSLCAFAIVAFLGSVRGYAECNDEQRDHHAHLCDMLGRVRDEPDELAAELQAFAREAGILVDPVLESLEDISEAERLLEEDDDKVPVVLAHGMGDSCFNTGMQSLTKYASQLLGGAYGTCIPTGDTQSEDTINGYFKSMDYNVEVFAEKVRANPKLANGFYGIGLSQGNNVIRGYLAMYNDPPVKRFISINGVNGGVGAVPHCIPKKDGSNELRAKFESICDLLMEQASKRAYNDFAQQHSFQAGYWRDPRPVEKEAYQTYSQLARWNNEIPTVNETLNDNWAKTEKFVWVKAEKDTMVWPPEGEHWGAPDPMDPFKHILPMNETEWYQKDLFGLKTAQEAGKNAFELMPGDHLEFSNDDFKKWINTYLK